MKKYHNWTATASTVDDNNNDRCLAIRAMTKTAGNFDQMRPFVCIGHCYMETALSDSFILLINDIARLRFAPGNDHRAPILAQRKE